MSQATIELGKGQDAAAQTVALSEGKKFPLTIAVTNAWRQPLVLAQAVPPLVIAAGDTVIYTCPTRAHLYDVVFGMIAVGERLGQAMIGSITTKLPKGASK